MPLGRVVHMRPPDTHVIRIDDAMVPAIAGIDACSHLIVLLQTNARETLEHTVGGQTVGVCATRLRERPSGIGVSVVELLRVDDELVYVRGLSALVDDVVLDLQPYVAKTDSVVDAVRPKWPVFEEERG